MFICDWTVRFFFFFYSNPDSDRPKLKDGFCSRPVLTATVQPQQQYLSTEDSSICCYGGIVLTATASTTVFINRRFLYLLVQMVCSYSYSCDNSIYQQKIPLSVGTDGLFLQLQPQQQYLSTEDSSICCYRGIVLTATALTTVFINWRFLYLLVRMDCSYSYSRNNSIYQQKIPLSVVTEGLFLQLQP